MLEEPRLSATDFAQTFYKTPALIGYSIRCGKPNCRCASTDYRHGPYRALFWRDASGQLCRRYVPKAEVARVHEIVQLRKAIDQQQRQTLADARAYLRELRQLGKAYRLW